MATYKTKAGDVLDKVCYNYYGNIPGAFEKTLAANPGLADLGPVLPASILIDLPEIQPPVITPPTLDLFG